MTVTVLTELKRFDDPAKRQAAWRYMQKYDGQTPFYSWLIYTEGKKAAIEYVFSETEWGELNAFMWNLRVEQQRFWADMDKQAKLYE